MTQVAPFTGAWIEIRRRGTMNKSMLASHPSRVRGLKYRINLVFIGCTGCRTLHGCVD